MSTYPSLALEPEISKSPGSYLAGGLPAERRLDSLQQGEKTRTGKECSLDMYPTPPICLRSGFTGNHKCGGKNPAKKSPNTSNNNKKKTHLVSLSLPDDIGVGISGSDLN